MNPLWAVAGVALLGTAGIAGAIVVGSPGGEEDAFQQVETSPTSAPALTPGPGVTLWRWMDVTVLIPDESGIRAFPETIYLDEQGTQSREGLRVGKADPDDSDISSYAQIDAEDGTVYRTQIIDAHSAEMELVLSSVSVSEFDPTTAPWPYNGDPPENGGNEEGFIRPDPATGIVVGFAVGSYGRSGTATPADCEAVGSGIVLRNGRSSAGIGLDANTSSVCKNLSQVQAEDLAAFERFLDHVALCVYQDAEC